jgi:hypothetical protein
MTFEVTRKPVTISGITAENKTYDGTATATVAGVATVVGRVGSDNVTVNLGTAAFEDKDAEDDKTVIFSGFTLDGAAKDNYELLAQPANVTANITKATATVATDPTATITSTPTSLTDFRPSGGVVNGIATETDLDGTWSWTAPYKTVDDDGWSFEAVFTSDCGNYLPTAAVTVTVTLVPGDTSGSYSSGQGVLFAFGSLLADDRKDEEPYEPGPVDRKDEDPYEPDGVAPDDSDPGDAPPDIGGSPENETAPAGSGQSIEDLLLLYL